jgi:hypothetical protein
LKKVLKEIILNQPEVTEEIKNQMLTNKSIFKRYKKAWNKGQLRIAKKAAKNV